MTPRASMIPSWDGNLLFNFQIKAFPTPTKTNKKNGLDDYMNMKRKQKNEKINGDERKKTKK